MLWFLKLLILKVNNSNNFLECPHGIQMLVLFYYYSADGVITLHMETYHCPL